MREQLRRDQGMGAFARLSLPAIEEGLQHGHVVIDGMYSWSEQKILKEAFGERIHVVAVVSSPKTRYSRLENRVHDARKDPQFRMRPLTAEEARKRDHAEIENIEKGGPIAMADFTVVNESAPQDMIDALLAYVQRVTRT
jgi:dephospho-CoA kinase